MKSKPTERQILGAKIRAYVEEYVRKRTKFDRKEGCNTVPSTKDRDNAAAKHFGLTAYEVSRFLTYSRSCTHPWAAGACPRCP